MGKRKFKKGDMVVCHREHSQYKDMIGAIIGFADDNYIVKVTNDPLIEWSNGEWYFYEREMRILTKLDKVLL